ncbi:MAG TPA: YdiU family protein [Kofleriaceae bacterium]|nr:YdiU family protein [Kofleriaceae bacterium]
MPASSHYRPAPRFTSLGDAFYDVVEPARFPKHVLRFRNQRWADAVGLGALTPAEWEAHFARFEPLPDNLPAPLALRYHGHQFQVYNPQLGDGRGFLFAQLEDGDGRLLDLATKGSGPTPWSRGGDGRLTLKGGVREILATEMLEALGVNTSKTWSLFETGEQLHRNDEPSPTRASVLVRLGHSHVRFGSFQRHAFHRDRERLRALLDYSLANFAPELCHFGDTDGAVRAFLQLVTERTARLCASWMAAGFVHGVLNSDNLNITGESFDYGPWRFLPVFDPVFTAAYFDHNALYAFGNQPSAVRWDLEQLALALQPIAGNTSLSTVRAEFEAAFEPALDAAIVRRVGVRSRGPLFDRFLRTSVFRFLFDSKMGFERFFFDAYGGRAGHGAAMVEDLAAYEPVDPDRRAHPYFAGEAPCTMLIDEMEALWAPIAERDDWTALEAKLAQIRVMADALGA